MASPQPAPSAPTGLPPGVEAGPLGKRFVAHVIDLLVPAVIGGVLALVSVSAKPGIVPVVVSLIGSVLIALWLILVWWMFATKAAGPGMRLMKLQLVGLKDGRPIGWGRFFVRALLLSLISSTGVLLVVMLILLIMQPRKQGWHDLAVNSVVIKERPLAPSRPRAAVAQQPVPAAVSSQQPAYAGQAPTARQSAGQQLDERRPPLSQAAANQQNAQPLQYGQPAPGVTAAQVAQTDPQFAAGQSAPSTEQTADSAAPLAPPAPEVPPKPLEPPSQLGQPAPTAPPAQEDPVSSQPVQGQFPAGSSPIEAGPPAVDGRPLELGWIAALDDGREIDISGVILLGRNPQPRPGEDDAELIKVADETRTVSKTHLALGVDANGMYVMDRGSTNGSTVTNSSGISKPCPAGDVVSVTEGNIVSFGDHWLEIRRKP
jgi:uncharacterized RDD family membrane protein YckC